MLRPLILLLAVVVCSGGVAQTPKWLKEFATGKIEKVSVDRLGDLFLVFKNGIIKKYNANGKVLATQKKKGAVPTLIEPWYHPIIFRYQRGQQLCTYYDHNFGVSNQYKLDPSIAINPFLVCSTNDNKLLVLDEADWSIKKINPATDQVINEFSIDTTALKRKPDFTYMREYQNMIFLLDKNSGIFIFSNLGKKINQIECTAQNFGFYGEELFYLSGDKVVLYDLYTEKNRDFKVEPGKFVIVTDERIFLVKDNNRVVVYEFLADVSEEKPDNK